MAKILIVEDEAIVAEDLAMKLRCLGYDISGITPWGEESTALASSQCPDLVLMDIRLAGAMDGAEAADRIRRDCDVPVIYLTANSDRAMLERAKVSEAFGYILKPFDERELETHIEMALYKHQAERRLRQKREWLQVTLQSIGDAVITTDATGKVTFLNPVASSLTGWQPQEAAGQPICNVFNIINKQTGQPAENIVARVLRENRIVAIADHTTLVAKDGREFPIEDSVAPITVADGKVEGVVIVFHDVTERNRAQETLRASEQRYRLLFDRNPDCVFSLDNTGRILDANPACETISGYSLAELTQKTFMELCAPDQMANATQHFQHSLSDLGYTEFETALIHKDGRRVEVWIAGEAILSNDKITALQCTAKDITARKRIEEDRIILSKLESTGILAGGLAHDFNNLLHGVRLNLEMAGAEMRAGQKANSYLEAAQKGALAAQNLTKQLIAFAKGGAPVRKLVLLSELMNAGVSLSLSGSTIRSDLSWDPNLHWTDVDEGQISQVIRNLVLNARDAMQNGGTVRVRAENVTVSPGEIPALAPGSYVRLSVIDQGHGISPAVFPKIFDPYFSTKQRGADKGMGLGLTICHTIAKNHGGAITVESQLGVGTTFKFYLPACQGPEPASSKDDAVAAPFSLQRHPKILVMDDEDCMRVAVGSALESRGFQVEAAKDGREAIDRYATAMNQGGAFDAVILDLTIRGGMGGKETIKALLKIDPAVKAIVMSGYTEDPVLLNPERYGFKAGMDKSFDVDQLTQAIERIIEARSQGETHTAAGRSCPRCNCV